MTSKSNPKTYSGSGQILAAALRRQAASEDNPHLSWAKDQFADKAEAALTKGA